VTVPESVHEREPGGSPGWLSEISALSDAVRRLAELTVTAPVPRGTLREVTGKLVEAAEYLCSSPSATRTSRAERSADDDSGDGAREDLSIRHVLFDMVIGTANPIAPPVVLRSDAAVDPPKVVGTATFGRVYEGAPGCVHGAALAGVFDIVLMAATRLTGDTGPTTRLSLRFRRPTLVGTECLFEAWTEKRDRRRVHSRARLIQRGEITIEAEGTYAILSTEQIEALGKTLT
jgi:hypothetical protein